MGYSTFSDDLGFVLAHISKFWKSVFLLAIDCFLGNLPSKKPGFKKKSSIIIPNAHLIAAKESTSPNVEV